MHGTLSNDALLTLVAKGDREAFRSLYRSTAPLLHAVCLRILRDRMSAQDVLQEAYVRIWQNARSFDPDRGAAMAWLVTITRRLAINEIRRRKSAPTAMEEVADQVELVAAEHSTGGPSASPKLVRCLQRLNEDHRKALLLAYVHGFSHHELAERLKRPLGTVKSWVRRGLLALRECLG